MARFTRLFKPPPTQRRYLFFLEPSFLFLAFLFQLLVSLSLPIIKPIHLFTLHIEDDSVVANKGEIRFGLWGFCFLNEYDIGLSDYGDCSPPEVGYTLNPAILSTLGLSATLYDIIIQGLVSVLLIHPVVATMTLVTMVPSVLLFSHSARIVTLVLNVFSAILSTVVSALDIAIILVAKTQIIRAQELYDMEENLGLKFRLSFGNAPWLGLVATVVLWAAVVAGSVVVCGCMGRIRFDEGDGEECAVAGAGEEEEGGGGGGGPESPGGIAADAKEKEKAKLKAKGEGKDAAATPPVDEDGSAVAGPEGNGEKRGWLDLIPKWSGYGRVQLEEEKCETAKGTS